TPPPLPCGRLLRDHAALRATASLRTHRSKPGAFAPPPAAAAVSSSLAGVGSARVWFWSLSASHACTLVIFQRAARVQPGDDVGVRQRLPGVAIARRLRKREARMKRFTIVVVAVFGIAVAGCALSPEKRSAEQ